MALNFPPSAVKPEYVKRGAGEFFIASYIAAGADGTDLRHMGPTQGGVEFGMKRTMHEVDVDQFLGPVAAFPIKEEFSVKVTLLDTTLATVRKALQLSVNTLTGGERTDNSAQLGLGEENAILYHQLVWRGFPAPQSAASAQIIQFFKCVILDVSAVKFEKGKETGVQVTFRALTDPSISTAAKVGKWIEA